MIKALSLWQPWASLMAVGAKRVETRHWRTWYRGMLAIHAAKRWTRDERYMAAQQPFADALQDGGVDPTCPPLGAVVAIGRLTSCVSTSELTIDERFPEHEREFGNYAPGRYGWVLTDVVRLPEPVLCSGGQGLWTPDDDLVEVLREAYREARAGVLA